ncbi:MAG: IclR family transcriptional regulator [Actinomycetota bacterium]|nr:IclR family transcriptional regulator [Acidimicrobiales bacterium]MEC8922925.1 IclR family transcriptional regulator [Actinomycetota bacterium]MEC9316211.1 IclR family transcriptional regulator [Actinomycetota bacterium]MED5541998.1 IclR family transcriptional regulator [Actinomycetota bacterium]MEE3186143.1 IclR family transcriptional regulator [Actinomycetota bacterium]
MAVVQSVHRAFAILRALSSGSMGVTEVSQRVGLPKSTVARLLAALDEEGAVRQERPGGRYSLDEGLLDLAGEVSGDRNLIAVARSHLLDLVDSIGETAGIGIRDGREVYYADHVMFDGEVQVRNWTGEHAPLHLVPSGLVFLAHMTSDELDAYLEGPLAMTTQHSQVSPSQIRQRLGQVRRVGYCWGYQEFAEGLNSVAAPVFNSRGEVIAALHVHGPAYRFPDPERTHDLGMTLGSACERMSLQLT